MKLALLLDSETAAALMARAIFDRRPLDMEAEVLLRRSLRLTDPDPWEAESGPAITTGGAAPTRGLSIGDPARRDSD